MSPSIVFENVSKQYRLGQVGTATIAEDWKRLWARVSGRPDPFASCGDVNLRQIEGGDFVWALRDIDLSVQQGEVFGIVGQNGAGKSTLLKLLSRVTAPSSGRIRAKGRIASLLEVGTGFHPELTGRENIFLNGSILGMTRQEISQRLDQIVEFSGCAKYIDTPVKRYSSGMTVRLGFAIAAHLECEILVIDEVLAVGDASFQKKCIGRMSEVAAGGKTVLFVSHNMQAVERLCTRACVIESGTLTQVGDVRDAIAQYFRSFSSRSDGHRNVSELGGGNDQKPVTLTSIKILDEHGNEPVSFAKGEKIHLVFEVQAHQTVRPVAILVRFMSGVSRQQVTSVQHALSEDTLYAGKSETLEIEIDTEHFRPGIYPCFFAVIDLVDDCRVYDVADDATLPLVISGNGVSQASQGVFDVDSRVLDLTRQEPVRQTSA